MSGHSKWSKIKRQKAVNDVAKGSLFAKLSKAITLAVVEGGGLTDPEINVKLRLAVEKARQENLPKENIKKAIERGTGPEKNLLKEVHYEAFGPGGAALYIVATTDNTNRTFTAIRNTTEMNGGKMGSQGSVGYMFEQCGTITFSTETNSLENVLSFAENINANDFDQESNSITVYIPFENIGKAREHLGSLQGTALEVEFRPITTIELSEEDQDKLILLIEAIEELEDVQNVYTNAVFKS